MLKLFEKIYAPFDGTITARGIDVGQLIDLGTTKEMFHLSAEQTLRVYVNGRIYTAYPAQAWADGSLARAAVAVGIDALFMEMHEDPDRTMPDGRPLSDGPNMLRIDDLPRLLDQVLAIRAAVPT